MTSKTSPRVLMISAEASSCLYGSRLIQHWKKHLKRQPHVFGIGDQKMVDEGFQAFGLAEDLAVMGVAEVVKKYSQIKKVFYDILAEIDRNGKPQVAILMDYPGFNLKLGMELKKRGIPVVYFVPPQVWAWKKSRVKKMQQFCDLVISILPFEKEFFERHEIKTEFVGHPLLDELDPTDLDEKKQFLERRRRGFNDDEFVLGIMPGSRQGEIQHHLAIQMEVARRLKQKIENLRILLLVAPTRTREELMDAVGDQKFALTIIKDNPFKMIRLCDGVLAASGTATLMVAMMQKPMVIMYRFNALTAFIAKLVVRGVRYFGLPNLILNDDVVPEVWQRDALPDRLTPLVQKLILDQVFFQTQKEKLKEIAPRLGGAGAIVKTAALLAPYLESEDQGGL